MKGGGDGTVQRDTSIRDLRRHCTRDRLAGASGADREALARCRSGLRALDAAGAGVSPEHVGFIGFSAGAMVTSGALLQRDPAARPAFAAMIYGAPFGVMPSIPAELPRVFLAWAHDDPIAMRFVPRFRDALVASGARPEVHEYRTGGHGFGMKKQGTPSDRWIDDFERWLKPIVARRSP